MKLPITLAIFAACLLAASAVSDSKVVSMNPAERKVVLGTKVQLGKFAFGRFSARRLFLKLEHRLKHLNHRRHHLLRFIASRNKHLARALARHRLRHAAIFKVDLYVKGIELDAVNYEIGVIKTSLKQIGGY